MVSISLLTGCSPDCNEGQMRCTGNQTDQCCNWFFNGVCTVSCPVNMVGDPITFDCGKWILMQYLYALSCFEINLTGCGVLRIANGKVVYSDGIVEGSTATFSCNPGYYLSTTGGYMCTRYGWIGSLPTCTCEALLISLNVCCVAIYSTILWARPNSICCLYALEM